MWLGGDVLLDLIGTRLSLAAAMIWWRVVHVLTGFSNSVAALGLFRGLLGMGEGCNWPGANKAVLASAALPPRFMTAVRARVRSSPRR